MGDSAGQLLWHARLTGEVVPRESLKKVVTIEDGYREQLGQIEPSGMKLVGWKLGATSAPSLEALKISEPFFGHVLEPYVFQSGDDVPIFMAHEPKLEAEFAVTLHDDLPRRSTPYTRADIESAVASISPSFEIVAFRMYGGFDNIGEVVIADSGANVSIALGKPVTDWAEIDLTSIKVEVSVNRNKVADGEASVLFWPHPLEAVTWLANHNYLPEEGLKAGQVVMTGSVAGLQDIKPGDTASADFGELGTVATQIAAEE